MKLNPRLLERLAIATIVAGLVMLMQPFSLEVYGYSFIVLLTGVAGFTIAGKLPN